MYVEIQAGRQAGRQTGLLCKQIKCICMFVCTSSNEQQIPEDCQHGHGARGHYDAWRKETAQVHSLGICPRDRADYDVYLGLDRDAEGAFHHLRTDQGKARQGEVMNMQKKVSK